MVNSCVVAFDISSKTHLRFDRLHKVEAMEHAAALVRRFVTRTCAEPNVHIISPKNSGLQIYRT